MFSFVEAAVKYCFNMPFCYSSTLGPYILPWCFVLHKTLEQTAAQRNLGTPPTFSSVRLHVMGDLFTPAKVIRRNPWPKTVTALACLDGREFPGSVHAKGFPQVCFAP